MSKPLRTHRKAPSTAEIERRLALLSAAFQEVAERGFSSVTLEDIAERAGVSKGITLYYFESKEALFRELFQWLIERIHNQMRESVSAAGDAVARMNALIDVIFVSPARNRAFFATYMDFASLAIRRESFRKVNEAFYLGCRDIEKPVIEEGIAQGVIPPQDPERAVTSLRAIFDGLMLRWLAEEDPEGTFEVYRERCRRESLAILGVRESREEWRTA